MVSRIEDEAQRLSHSGACQQWLLGAEDKAPCFCPTPSGCWAARVLGAVAVQVAGVVRDVNGPLMEVLAQAIAYHDAGVVDMLRDGGLLLGLLKCTGNGRPSEPLLKCSKLEVHEGLEARVRLSVCAACATYVLHVSRNGIEQC